MPNSILDLLPAFEHIKVVVAGDLMLDTYCKGTVHRRSPEAPVDVLDWESSTDNLGGAANVALNIHRLNAQVALTGWIGNDVPGQIIRDLLKQNKIDDQGLMELTKFPTTHKTRYLHDSKHLLRVDHETHIPALQELIHRQIQEFDSVVQGSHAVVLQDYDKGYFNGENIREFIASCQKKQIPIAVDPKKTHFWNYQGVDLFKPNLKELQQALGRSVTPDDDDDLQAACQEARDRLACRILMVTLGERGIAVLDQHGWFRVEGLARKVVDVCGAGDSVIASAACGLALGWNAQQIAELANICGGLACEHSGTHPVTLAQIQATLT